MSRALRTYWSTVQLTAGMAVLASVFVASHVVLAVHTFFQSPGAMEPSANAR